MLDHALELAGIGWPVFPLHNMVGIDWNDDGTTIATPPVNQSCSCGRPCSSPGKHPRTQSGVKEATLDPAALRAWWASWPLANIGLATGAVSGVYVVDLDGQEGIDAWAAWALVEDVDEPELSVTTGSGGRHLYFGLDLDEQLPSTHWKIARGVDTRGGPNAYVVAPPSNHQSGGTYEWVGERGILSPLPRAVRTAVTPKISTPQAIPRIGDSTTRYGHAILVDAIRTIQAAPEGTRNATLNKQAFKVGQWIGAGEIHPAGVEHLLAEACMGPDKRKNTGTVRRALHDGTMHPRTKEDRDVHGR